ncbi:hypothetical protein AB0I77_06615 [Streptomyces sp. NPDC050619]|uniref:hypothetical protein n=1 Tax=Streptomyces sp. NPDC050619 TaxID=3157214 RepID=UPI00343CBE5E
MPGTASVCSLSAGSRRIRETRIVASSGSVPSSRERIPEKVDSIEQLFTTAVENTASELHAKVDAVVAGTANTASAARLPTGVRLFVRLSHEDPAIGKFRRY